MNKTSVTPQPVEEAIAPLPPLSHTTEELLFDQITLIETQDTKYLLGISKGLLYYASPPIPTPNGDIVIAWTPAKSILKGYK